MKYTRDLFTESLPYFEKAEPISERLVAMSKDECEYFAAGMEFDRVIRPLAHIYEKIGNDEKAEEYLIKRVEFWEATVEKDDSVLSAINRAASVKALKRFYGEEENEEE